MPTPKMTKEEREEKEAELELAADVYESLLVGADGDTPLHLESPFGASTILAMIKDRRYANKVKKKHEEKYG